MSELLGITGAIGSGKTTFAACLGSAVQDHAIYETGSTVAEVAAAFNEALRAELAFETAGDDLELTNQVLIWLPDAIQEHLHHNVVWSQLAIKKHDTLSRPELYEKLFVYLESVRKNQALLDTPITTHTKEQFRPLLQWLGGYLAAKVSKTVWLDELMRRIELRNSTVSLAIVSGLRYPSDAAVIRQHGGRIIALERPETPGNDHDVTETSRSTIIPDCVVLNNGSLVQLQVAAETLWNDIQGGHPKKQYEAASQLPAA